MTDLTRTESYQGLLAYSRIRIREQQAEIARLQAEAERQRAMAVRVAERLTLASEVLSIRAERADRRNAQTPDGRPRERSPVDR